MQADSNALAFAGDALCTASGLELYVTRCPVSAPTSTRTGTDATASSDRADEVLRGVEEAAEELTGRGLFT